MSYIGTEPKDIRSFGRTKFDYTATQGQTAFTGADDDGKILNFTVGQIEVYVNGILMDDSDFTTTGTGTVTLATAANLNDVINIVSFETNIPDSNYVPASGGTFTGDVDFGANKITYANLYANLSDLPSASTYHGMFAHVHATGLAYYAHAGAWIPLANLTGSTFTGPVTVDTSTTTNLTVDSANYGGIQFKAAGTKTGYITSFTGATESMYIGGADKVNIHTGTNHDLTGGTTRLQIDASGNVTTPNQPAFLAKRNSTAAWSNSTISFPTETYDRGNNYNTSNSRFTAPVAGVYVFHVQLTILGGTSGQDDTMYWYFNKNGSGFQTMQDNWSYRLGSAGNGVEMNIAGTAVIPCNANDYVDVSTSGISHTGGKFHTSSYFSGYLLG